MVKKRKTNELTQIYDLFARVPSNFKHISEQFKKYIQHTGESFSHDAKLKSPIGLLKYTSWDIFIIFIYNFFVYFKKYLISSINLFTAYINLINNLFSCRLHERNFDI